MKRIVASVVLTGLLVPAFAFAQDTGTTQPVRPTPPPPEVRKEVEARKQQIQEKREEIKTEVQNRVETRKAEIDAKRDEVKQKVEDRQQKVEDRREDVKEKVTEKKAERQDNRLQNVKASFERMAKVFDATLARLTTLKDRLAARVTDLQSEGVNVTASTAALSTVDASLAKNKAEIDGFKTAVAALVIPTSTGSTTAKLDLTSVRKEASDVQASFKESRTALEAAVKAIKADARAANVSADNE